MSAETREDFTDANENAKLIGRFRDSSGASISIAKLPLCLQAGPLGKRLTPPGPGCVVQPHTRKARKTEQKR